MFKIFTAFFIILPTTVYAENEKNVYTLYKNSPYIEQISSQDEKDLMKSIGYNHMRNHVATFDSQSNDPTHNQFMCNRVKSFFEKELIEYYGKKIDTDSDFWCEKGYYSDK